MSEAVEVQVARLAEQIRSIHDEIAGVRREQAAEFAGIRGLIEYEGRTSAAGMGFVQERVRSIESKVDDVERQVGELQRWQASRQEFPRQLDDHENRIGALERFQWKLMGGAAVIGVVGGAGAARVAKLLEG